LNEEYRAETISFRHALKLQCEKDPQN